MRLIARKVIFVIALFVLNLIYRLSRRCEKWFSIGVWRYFVTHRTNPTWCQRIGDWFKAAIHRIRSAIGLPPPPPSIFTPENSFSFELYYGGIPLLQQRGRSQKVFSFFSCLMAMMVIALVALFLSLGTNLPKQEALIYLIALLPFLLYSFSIRSAFFRAHILFLEPGDALPEPTRQQAGIPIFSFLGRPRTYYLAVQIMGFERRADRGIAKRALETEEQWIYTYPRHSEHHYQTRFLADLAAHVTRIFFHRLLPAENRQSQRTGSLYFSYKTYQSLISMYLMLLCAALISLAPCFPIKPASMVPFLALALAIWAVFGIYWARRIAFPRYRHWSHYLALTSLENFYDARTYYFNEENGWQPVDLGVIRELRMGQLTPEQGVAIENILTFAVTGMVAVYLALLQLFK